MPPLPQRPVAPRTDLRDMLRAYVAGRALACMERAAERRRAALASAEAFAAYRTEVRAAVRGFYGALPAGPAAPPPAVTPVGGFECDGFRVENVLFDSFPGWQVNATVYVPADFSPPFPAVVVPVGHSGKQFETHQMPCQYFARSGFIAVSFDPPGQAGEKQPGNDHFADGVRDYLVGATSSRYFVADALRCIDYLATRPDADMGRGVAMTGVSGGGTTTSFAVLLDERIAVIGPSCCLAPLADLDISQCYAGCPETHQWRRYAAGADEVDLLCAAAPTPCLLMAGEEDEVFRIADTRRLAGTAAAAYARAGADGRFRFFADTGGHAYTLRQAREFVRFAAPWAGCDPDRAPEPDDPSFALISAERLRCRPRTDVNMRTRAAAEAAAFAADRDRRPEAVRRSAAGIVGAAGPVPVPEAEAGEPFRVWCHDWRSVMLRPEPDIELPATLLTPRTDLPAPAVLHLDDAGRHRALYRHGPLASAVGFVDREGRTFGLLTVDLRGWGDTAAGVYPYEIASWGAVDRWAAYATAALGDSLFAMRVRDALAALAWLRTRPEIDPDRIVLTGSGLAGAVALHAAAVAGRIAGVVAWDGLSSWESLVAAERYPWPADAFVPGALVRYDLPELAAALECPVRLFGLRDGAGLPASPAETARYRAPNVETAPEADPDRLAREIQLLLER